jgi:hypothetical protein
MVAVGSTGLVDEATAAWVQIRAGTLMPSGFGMSSFVASFVTPFILTSRSSINADRPHS